VATITFTRYTAFPESPARLVARVVHRINPARALAGRGHGPARSPDKELDKRVAASRHFAAVTFRDRPNRNYISPALTNSAGSWQIHSPRSPPKPAAHLLQNDYDRRPKCLHRRENRHFGFRPPGERG
jgi:hypothetical protein